MFNGEPAMVYPAPQTAESGRRRPGTKESGQITVSSVAFEPRQWPAHVAVGKQVSMRWILSRIDVWGLEGSRLTRVLSTVLVWIITS